jgi:glycosyltransferase 2 family protein
MRGWSRHPADAARLAVAAVVLLASLGFVAAYPDITRAISSDIVRLARHLPVAVQQGTIGLLQIVSLATPLVLVGLAIHWRRPWQVVAAVGAGVVAGLAVASLQGWLDDTTPPSAIEGLAVESWITGAAFPSSAYLATLAAGFTVLSPSFSRQWRRAVWVWIIVLCVARMLTAVAVPLQLVTIVSLGITVGSVVLVVFGSPARRFDLTKIPPALATAGFVVDDLEAVESSGRLSRRLRASLDSEPIEVRVVGREERDADLLLRAVRAIRVKGVEEGRPGWSPTRAIEHEALCSLLASGAGVRTPAVLGTAETDDGDGVLVVRDVGGRPLVDLTDDELTDAVLVGCWEQLAALHRRAIAHGQPNLEHFELGPGGAVLLDGFRAGHLGADDRGLGTDIADLLGAQAARVGVDRAVTAAVAAMPADALARALPLVQPLAVSAATRAEVKERADKSLWGDVRTALQERLGVEKYELTHLQRIGLAQLVGLLGAGLLVYVLLAFASNWSDIEEALREADWTYLPWIIALAIAGYGGGALSLMGAVPLRLPFLQTVQVMFAQSFLNRFTPANAGGMALRARYLQQNGIDLTLSAASVGLTSAASGVMQVVLLIVFATWAGSSDDIGFSTPDATTIAGLLLGVLVIAGGLYLLPWGRRFFGKLLGSLWKAAKELLALAKDPVKVVQLFGGATIGKVTTILAFVLSVRAFGVDDISFAVLGLAYMTANTVASAAPTPGGLGAIEAALVAVLTGLGVDSATALSIVLVFRLVTYWMPVLPSWLFLRHLRRVGTV